MVEGGGEFVDKSIPVAASSKAFVCDRLICGIADSKPTEGMGVRLLCL